MSGAAMVVRAFAFSVALLVALWMAGLAVVRLFTGDYDFIPIDLTGVLIFGTLAYVLQRPLTVSGRGKAQT